MTYGITSKTYNHLMMHNIEQVYLKDVLEIENMLNNEEENL